MYEIVPVNGNKGWIVSSSNMSGSDIADLVMESKVLVTDLDDTLGPSPAKRYILEHAYNPMTWPWFLEAGIKTGMKGSESEMWSKYVKRFIGVEVRMRMSPDKKPMLYNGVEKTFDVLPHDMRKMLITRNIRELSIPYQNLLGITEAEYEVDNKSAALENGVVSDERYVLFGDSEEDIVLASDANISVCIARNPEEYINNFTIVMSRDWTPLARILQEK